MRLNELFSIEICRNPISREFALENPGTIPYITTTSENNGIEAYVDFPARYNGGVLTVSKDGGSADAFVQSIPFCGNEKVMVLQPLISLSTCQLLYYALVISSNKYKFCYGRKCSVARLSEIQIPSINEIPTFINEKDIKPIATEVRSINKELTTVGWSEFHMDDLFIFVKGTRLTKDDMEEGNTNYIGAICDNNGIRQKIDKLPLSKGNCITVNYNGSVGEAFYQAEPFWASDDVNILYAKEWTMNKYSALFLVTVIKANRYRFSYGRKWTMEKMKDTILKLPISAEGLPDFDYMENYIRSLPYSDRI